MTTASESHPSETGGDGQTPAATAGTNGSVTPASKPINLWCQAYVSCYDEKGKDAKLLDDLKEILAFQASPEEGAEAGGDGREREFEALSAALKSDLPKIVKNLEDHKWKIPLIKGEVDFGDVVEKCVDVVALAKDFVGEALSANPYASLGWSAVCIGIQLVKNPIKGQRDFLDAFHTISEIIHRFAVVETLPQISANESVLKETAIKLYRLIIIFQAEALKHLKRHTIHRVWNNTIDPNHWSNLLQGIKDQEGICNETLTRESNVAIVKQSRDIGGIRKELQESVKNQMDAVKKLQSQMSDMLDEQAFSNLLNHCADGAVYSSDKPRCLADTRLEIRSQILSWATSDKIDDERIYWITGMAGMGKSTIASTIADHCHEQGYAVVSFFFSRDSSSRGKTDRLVPTIARQLMDSSDILKHYICKALRGYHGHFDHPADEQWTSLIKGPLESLEATTQGSLAPPAVVIVIDALDECGEDVIKHITSILDGLKEISSICFRALLTSRRTEPILNEMSKLSSAKRELDLYKDVKPDEINKDICRYYEHKLHDIKTEYCNNRDPWDTDEDELQKLQNWPTEELVSLLVEKTDGLFQYAKVACNIIQGNNSDESPAKRVQYILDRSVSGGLDELYSKALVLSVPHGVGTTEDDIERFFANFRLIVGSILFSLEPLTGYSIAALLGKEEGTDLQAIRRLVGRLRSVLSVPDRPDQVIKSIHLSLRELLGDEARCKNYNILKFHVKEDVIHNLLFRCCTKVLGSSVPLRYCTDRTMTRIFLEESYENRCVPPGVRYASLFWTAHCRRAAPKSQVLMLATEFVAQHGNAWIGILFFLREPQEEMRSAVVFEDMVDDIKQSIGHGLSAERLQLLEDILRSLFEDLEY